MKKKGIKVLLAFMLMGTIQIQSSAVYAATLPQNQVVMQEKSTADGEVGIGANATYDITDGDSNVNWPKGPNAQNLTSDSAILMDADTGLILYNKNMTTKRYPASITKILTTLLCIENCSLDETVTFKKEEVTNLEYGASNIETQIGETLTVDQCLYGIMLASANEVCLGVADHIAGSIPAFGDMMNEKAQELGCVNTHFVNPNGLHDDNHYTCAYDMALISKEALKSATFRRVAGSKVAYLDKTNKHAARTLTNHHNMLYSYTTSDYLNPDCIGGKTGFTSVAQSTLVTFAERDGMTLICVVMHGVSSKTNANANIYTDTKALLDYGFDNYESHDLSANVESTTDEESPFFTEFSSILNQQGSPLQTSNAKIVLPVGVKVGKATQKVTFYKKGEAKNSTEIGKATYMYGNKTVGSTGIYFDPKACKNELTTDSDITYTKSTNIVGENQATSRKIRHIAIGICGVVLAVVLVLFIAYRRINATPRRRKYSTPPNRYRDDDLS